MPHFALLLPPVAERARAGVGGRMGGELAVEPGEHRSFHTPGYTETDAIANGFALAFGSRDATDTRSELGARFDRVLAPPRPAQCHPPFCSLPSDVSFATLLARADLHPVISVDVAGGAAPDQLDSGGAPQTRRSRS